MFWGGPWMWHGGFGGHERFRHFGHFGRFGGHFFHPHFWNRRFW